MYVYCVVQNQNSLDIFLRPVVCTRLHTRWEKPIKNDEKNRNIYETTIFDKNDFIIFFFSLQFKMK